MKTTCCIASIILAALPLTAGAQRAPAKTPTPAVDRKLYCWEENGVQVCGDTVPADALDRARTEISAQRGHRTGTVARAPSPEERAEAAAAARAQAEAERAARDALTRYGRACDDQDLDAWARDALPQWLRSLAVDSRLMLDVLAEGSLSTQAKRSLVGGLNYLVQSLDLIDDGIEGLGHAGGAPDEDLLGIVGGTPGERSDRPGHQVVRGGIAAAGDAHRRVAPSPREVGGQVGGGRADDVRQWIEQSGDDRFTFGPFLDEAGFIRAIHASDLFVVTEKTGSGGSFIPSKLIPAISTGTPILAVCDREGPLGEEMHRARLGPHVEGGHPGAETLRGGDGLESGHPDAEDEDLRRGDRSGRGHHHGEDRVHAIRGHDDRNVAGQVRLRADRVHFLREGGSRHHLKADRAHLLSGECGEEIFFLKGVEEADVDCPGLEFGHVFGGGLAHAGDEVGGGEGGGAAEVTPLLGVADAIVDVVDTGSTLRMNGLREIGSLLDSTAVLIANPAALMLSTAMMLRQELVLIRRVLAPQRDILSALIRRELPFLSPEIVPYFADVHDHILRLTEEIDTFRELVTGVVEVHASTSANQLNRTMQTLTGWSIILMSMSVVAGIYGMNFTFMPELDLSWGYPGALLLMIAVGFGLYSVFRGKGWL